MKIFPTNCLKGSLGFFLALIAFTYSVDSSAQYSINGASSANQGELYHYSISTGGGNSISQVNWQMYYGGTITNQYFADCYVIWTVNTSGALGAIVTDYYNNQYSLVKYVTVNVPVPSAPPAPTVQSTNCGNTVLSKVSSPSGVTYYWQDSASGTSTSNSSSTITKTIGGTQYLRARNSSGTWSTTSSSVSYTVKVVPGPASGDDVTRCDPGPLLLSATPGSGADTIRWYNAGGTLLATSTSYGPVLSVTTAYYAESYNSATGCASSSRTKIEAIVNATPPPATGDDVSRCGPGTVMLTASSGAGNTVRWYSASTGGTLLATSPSYTTPSLSGTTTYYAESYNSDAHCGALSRTAIKAIINAIPPPATGDDVSRCGPGTVMLTAASPGAGNTVRWYSALTGGTLLGTSASYTTPSLSGTTTYYAENYNSITHCWATSRTAIRAIVNALPPQATGDDVSRCGPGTVMLTASPGAGNTVRWYNVPSGGTLLATSATYTTPSLSGTTAYYAESYNGDTGCWAANRTEIQAVINGVVVWYADADGDSFGDPAVPISACTAPAGYVANNTDACPTEAGSYYGCAYTPAVLSNENYIYTRTFQSPMGSESEIRRDSDIMESITYFDGLGRPMQSIGIKASPDKKDIITHIGYDEFGRQDKDWLPYYESTGSLGSYRGDRSLATQQYYQANYPDDFMNITNALDINAYSQKDFEASPLNRVSQQAAPGKDWKLGSGHEIGFGYLSNAALEVARFDVDITASVVGGINVFEPALVQNGTYGAGELYKTVTEDENYNGSVSTTAHTTEEFKDKQGRVVLKRTYGDSDTNMDGTIAGVGEVNVAHDTYYVYDDYGNLSYVIPPKVDISDGVSPTELSELCYQYRYDERNRLVERRIPGKGWEYIIYNKLDRPIATQDANLRENDEVLYTLYDAFGRVAFTAGIVGLDLSRTMMQSSANMFATQYVSASASPTTIAGTDVYYTVGDMPVSYFSKINTINYYDSYVNLPSGLSNSISTYYGLVSSTSTKGLPTVSKVRVLDPNTVAWITTVSYYNDKGMPIYVYSENPYLGTVDIMESKLDFTGKVMETKTTHKKTGKDDIVVLYAYTYDHVGRLKTQTQTIDSLDTELIVSNTYDDLGQLESKKVGGDVATIVGNSLGLQTVDYTYNIRGWLKDINNEGGSNSSIALGLGDLFGFQINYNDPSMGTALFNGNISQTFWKTTNADNGLKSYSYTYDALNRITGATGGSTANYDLDKVVYDGNGNITKLKRQGQTNTGATTFGTMDDLAYTYGTISNKLVKVQDIGNGSYGFVDSSNIATEYTYDTNGNMLRDYNKGIATNITYNHLNLPTYIALPTGNISYIYDATGTKLSKTVSPGNTTYYAGNYVYEGSSLKFFNHAEGYVDAENGYKYVYQYKDHLGNVRLSYRDVSTTSTPVLEILDEKNYYPFGGEHKGYNSNINGTYHPYGFNGKEEQDELGLQWMDFGARNYDKWLGRWMNLDPLAEAMRRHSPYNFAFNNPLRFIDPDGMAPDDIVIRMLNEQGKSVEAFRIHTDLIETEINLESNGLTYTGTETTNVYFDEKVADYAEKLGGNLPDAVSLNASAEAAYKGGAQLEVSVLGILKGENKGDFGVNLQVNGLLGIEAGITGSVTGFYATQPNPDLDVFKGAEIGLQADVKAFGPASISGAYNQGVEFQWPIGSDGNWRGFTKTTYEAITLGVSGGVVPLPVSFSGYLGVSDYLYRSDK